LFSIYVFKNIQSKFTANPPQLHSGRCGAEEELNEPFVRLLMLIRTVNEENVMVKESDEEVEV